MKITLLTLGKLKRDSGYLATGIDEYIKRIRPFAQVEVVELPDEAITPTRTRDQVLAVEEQRILSVVDRGGYVIALSERGKHYDSETFADEWAKRLGLIGNPLNGGTTASGGTPIIFIVGGALGLSQTVLERADWVFSLSPMTFPHLMVRLILLEQVYRAFKILHNEPYHK
jgi:23S rRNA (pseudouridine1915-N3)-methyltransferase